MTPISLGPIQQFILIQLLIAWLRKLGLLPPDPAPDEGDLTTVNDVRNRALAYVDSLTLSIPDRIAREGKINAICNQWIVNGCNFTWTPTT